MTDPAHQADRGGRRASRRPERPARRREPPVLPEHARMGLLDRITAHSLDEDYAQVSQRRAAGVEGAPRPAGRKQPRRVLTFATVAVFGVIVTTAGIQTARTEPVRRTSQQSLAAQVLDRREELADRRQELVTLRREVDDAQRTALEASRLGREVSDRLQVLGAAAGAEPVSGPGVRIQVDDSDDPDSGQVVLDTDLQRLVNGLWVSGAEAVDINGQRLTALSAIRVAGEAITVNLRSLSRPYVIRAIGDPDQLPARFLDSAGGSWWLNLRSVYDLQFEMTPEELLTVPAAPDLDLRHATTLVNPGSPR